MATPALQAFLQDQFGGSFNGKVKKVTVGTTPTLLAGNNFERMGLVIAVIGSVEVFISIDENVTTADGMPLTASGEVVSLTAAHDQALVGYGWYGIVSSGTCDVFVLESVRYSAD